MESILLINVKMPTIVGILTFISRVNIISEGFQVRKIFSFQNFSFHELIKFSKQYLHVRVKFHAQLS